MSRRTFAAKLADHRRNLHVSLEMEEVELMVQLDQLVVNWNRSINLIGFKSEEERLEKYFIEALHAAQILPETGQAVDIGSGGGTPALPLAISRTGIEWTLLEPNKKKVMFLEEAVESLGLSNVEVRRERYNGFEPRQPIDLVTTRGLAVDGVLLSSTLRWLKCGGCLCLWTSRKLANEILARDNSGWRMRSKESLPPRYESCLLILERIEVTSEDQ